ncbi:MAG: HAMP domain-containing histidine kinase [Oscillospiraceae bacterium]|jgi:signal transduction histidine kinase|nr:HAMP domain-containing histidine kinase [Oscillospiraceae bacterium]
MKNSVFLRRIVLLLLAAVLLTGLLTSAIYIFVTQRAFGMPERDAGEPFVRREMQPPGGPYPHGELNIYDKNGKVLFTRPVKELNETLIMSVLISFAVMLVPGYLAARRLVVPIRQMQGVARAMARGEFSVRADETQKGEIGELGRAMNHFADESGRLEQTRRDFVANVSHELRTPIASIRAMGETLRDGMAKSDEKKTLFYNNIVRESMRLSRLVDDLLELSRLQSGAEAMKKTRFDLREVFRNIADSFELAAADAGTALNIDEPDEPLRVFSNPDRIEQLLVIIMDNALKHAGGGGTVTLTARQSGEKVTVGVSNTGETIAAEDLANIFERFYKADKSHSGEGYGLGLSIAREIVGGLGESIRAASADGVTTFEFTVSQAPER